MDELTHRIDFLAAPPDDAPQQTSDEPTISAATSEGNWRSVSSNAPSTLDLPGTATESSSSAAGTLRRRAGSSILHFGVILSVDATAYVPAAMDRTPEGLDPATLAPPQKSAQPDFRRGPMPPPKVASA